jgi:putative ABC transport system permease protein
LALRSLRNRLLTTTLTVLSIALSVALLVGVESIRSGVRQGFIDTIRGTDLIVGARGGSLQTLLFTVFGVGAPSVNVSYETYQRWARHPAVKWTIPYALGDSHRSFRVVGTDNGFFRHYRYGRGDSVRVVEGRVLSGEHDAVIGYEVARELAYRVGQEIVLTHGLAGFTQHEQDPFTVVGVLARTFTPIDRSIYVPLEGVEAMHEEPSAGVKPSGLQDFKKGNYERHEPTQVTSFLVGTKNRAETLQLQREMNVDLQEPLTAIVPAVALGELWRNVGYAESGLRVVSLAVLLVGLLGMVVSLYTSLNERRREMAILRAVGAGPRTIVSLLVIESGLLAALGALLGVVLAYGFIALLRAPIEARFGLHLALRAPGKVEWLYVGGVVLAGFIVGLVPAWKAYRNTLADGLSVRL